MPPAESLEIAQAILPFWAKNRKWIHRCGDLYGIAKIPLEKRRLFFDVLTCSKSYDLGLITKLDEFSVAQLACMKKTLVRAPYSKQLLERLLKAPKAEIEEICNTIAEYCTDSPENIEAIYHDSRATEFYRNVIASQKNRKIISLAAPFCKDKGFVSYYRLGLILEDTPQDGQEEVCIAINKGLHQHQDIIGFMQQQIEGYWRKNYPRRQGFMPTRLQFLAA